MKNLFLLLSFFLSISISYSQGYSTNSLSEDITNNSDLIVRSSTEIHDIQSESVIKSSYHYAYTLMNHRMGLQNVRVYYENNISKIKDLKINIYDANGFLVSKVKKKDITTQKAYSQMNMADDLMFLYYENNYKSFPLTIEVSYTQESRYAATIPSFRPYPFQNHCRTFVEQSSYEIIGNKSDITFKAKNVEGYKEFINMSSYPMKVQVNNLPILKKESYTPPAEELLPQFYYARKKGKFNKTKVEFSDWESYGKWMYDAYLEDKLKLTPETIDEITDYVEGYSDPFEKAKKVYEYVVDNTRYISIQLGEGGLEPFPAEETHDKKYGDCKALSIYTLALMKAVEVPAFYTIIQAGTDAQEHFEHDFASIQQGNHAIIGIEIEGDTVYADCTTSHIPFGTISSFTDGRWAVGINEEGGKILKTTKYKDKENASEHNSFLQIDPSAKTLNIRYNGTQKGVHISENNRFTSFSEEDLTKKVFPYLHPSFSKETFQNANLKYDQTSIKESFEISTKKFISTAGNYIMIPLQIHSFPYQELSGQDRTMPFYFKDGYHKTYHTEIEIPEGYELVEKIEEENIESIFGSYTIEASSKDEGFIQLKIDIKTKSGTFPAHTAEIFNKWLSEIKTAEKTNIIFKPISK